LIYKNNYKNEDLVPKISSGKVIQVGYRVGNVTHGFSTDDIIAINFKENAYLKIADENIDTPIMTPYIYKSVNVTDDKGIERVIDQLFEFKGIAKNQEVMDSEITGEIGTFSATRAIYLRTNTLGYNKGRMRIIEYDLFDNKNKSIFEENNPDIPDEVREFVNNAVTPVERFSTNKGGLNPTGLTREEVASLDDLSDDSIEEFIKRCKGI